MKKYFYFVFSVFVVLAICVIGAKYWQEYSFKRDLSRLINIGIGLDQKTEAFTKAIGDGLAYQMAYPEYFFEEGDNQKDFLEETAEMFAQGAVQKEDIIKYANEALKNPAQFKSPETDEAYVKYILADNMGEKAQALAKEVEAFQKLESKLIYNLKEQELPLDALFWANEIKQNNISAEQLDLMHKNWIGDEKQNEKLVALAKKYAQSGKARPLTEKEQAMQAYYNNRIGLVINPVLQDKKQIAALTPEVCTGLMAEYWSAQILGQAISLDEFIEVQKDWAKDEAFKVNFAQKLTEKIKENKPRRFTYLEILQLNTCNNM